MSGSRSGEVRMGIAHLYVSTGCIHAEHGSCRKTCKFCGEPCICPCHPGGAGRVLPVSPVDQARDVARKLYEAVRDEGLSVSDLDADQSLFWLRGEVPPGEWGPPGEVP